MWSNIIIQFLCLLPLLGSKPVEAIRFDVLHKGNSIGEFKAVRTDLGDSTIFENITDLKTNIIGEVAVNYRIHSTFKHNELEYAKVDIMVNGKPYSNTTTKRFGNNYKFYKNGKLKTTLTGPIRYSAAMMVFNEPIGFTTAYSEESGGFHSIAKAVVNVYEKQNARGRKTCYHYQDEALKSMDIDIGLTKIEMVLKK